MSVFHFLGTIFGHFRPNATPRKWTTFLNTILRHLSQLHISFESAFALGPHIFFPFALGPHIFFRFALGPHIFFFRLHLGRTFLFSMQKLFVWAFSVTSFCSGISCEEGLSDCRTELFVFVGDCRQKVLVSKYKVVGNIQAAATSPRSLNSVLKLRGNRDVEVESNQLSLERKYLW